MPKRHAPAFGLGGDLAVRSRRRRDDRRLGSANRQPRAEPIPLELFLRYSAWFAERFVAERDTERRRSDQADGIRIPRRHESGRRVRRRTHRDRGRRDAVRLRSAAARKALRRHDRILDRASRRRRQACRPARARRRRRSGRSRERGSDAKRAARSSWSLARSRTGSPTVSPTGLAAGPAAALPPGLPGDRLRPAAAEPSRPLPRSLCGVAARREATLDQAAAPTWGSPWLRPLIDGNVRVTERCTVKQVEESANGLVVDLSDGSKREVDDVLIACGYRFDLDRLTFLSPERELLSRSATAGRCSTASSAPPTSVCSSSATRPRDASARSRDSSSARSSPLRGSLQPWTVEPESPLVSVWR